MLDGFPSAARREMQRDIDRRNREFWESFARAVVSDGGDQETGE